ncbi:hypothetical protein BCR37DRAFT_375828 [Protomyces lactucae-debilis]|uniref:Uncharacterized protein n=1 Tax=Protomyces lactucae-debilis TaxID=2754530 RepID=A0A1Y2FV38_PROLT|nr:uncharacterized protein BCR37DRAFT_375828 [Protomyces lactucae-debilis]ORY87871.1 hypothetical protein BCR37DRAFT_375828 [Protomyces lactucae-debilis]
MKRPSHRHTHRLVTTCRALMIFPLMRPWILYRCCLLIHSLCHDRHLACTSICLKVVQRTSNVVAVRVFRVVSSCRNKRSFNNSSTDVIDQTHPPCPPRLRNGNIPM